MRDKWAKMILKKSLYKAVAIADALLDPADHLARVCLACAGVGHGSARKHGGSTDPRRVAAYAHGRCTTSSQDRGEEGGGVS